MKIYFPRDIPETAYHMLHDAGHTVLINSDNCVLPHEQLVVTMAQHKPDAIVATVDDKIDAAVLDAAGPQLQIIANYAVGYNNIDLAECARRNITEQTLPMCLPMRWQSMLSLSC
jgi:glyoxylate reductase